jgi:3'-phosphoadenosine 5'-phosphosulfate sulfotransferase (PAPS reductase)/FAD synthetase
LEILTPYYLPGPALISFSGGRTSAFMLHEILRAHKGKLPPDVIVAFANTGKEREETLRFVHDCATHWDVRVRWVEWRPEGFEEVGFNSASRSGEPFAGVIAKKSFLPNAVTRFCTQELKIRVMRDLMRSLGYEHWVNAIGLRYDEGLRVMKALARNDAAKERFTTVMPLSKAHVTKRDVMAFWAKQSFDLQLLPHEGNCDLCFLKSRGKLEAIVRDVPGRADWWIEQERLSAKASKPTGARFVTEYSYSDIVAHVSDSPTLFDDDEHDAECGLLCAAE